MFFDPATGISALLPQTGEPEGRRPDPAPAPRCSTRSAAPCPGSSIEDLFHLGDGTGTFAVSYGLTDADQLRTATLTGPVLPRRRRPPTCVTLTDYGTPVEITSP